MTLRPHGSNDDMADISNPQPVRAEKKIALGFPESNATLFK